MDNIAKKRIKKCMEVYFGYIKKNGFYQKIKKANLAIRILVSLFFFVWFLVGTILMPPIPFGNIALILGLVVLFPLAKVRTTVEYIINKRGIKKLYTQRLVYKYKTKQQYKKYFGKA